MNLFKSFSDTDFVLWTELFRSHFRLEPWTLCDVTCTLRDHVIISQDHLFINAPIALRLAGLLAFNMQNMYCYAVKQLLPYDI